jgi:hypothetical protein
MSRPRYETVAKMLNRLSATIKKKTSPKSVKKSSNQSALKGRENMILGNIECKVILKRADESTVDTQVLCNNEITSGMSFELESLTYTIMRNPPVTTALKLFPKTIILSNYPVVPTITVENADGVDCLWFCEQKDKSVFFLGSGVTCTPGAECVGNRIKMICTPWRWAEENDLIGSDTPKSHNDGPKIESNRDELIDLNACGELNHNLNQERTTEKVKIFTNNDQMLSENERSKFPERRVILGRAAVCYSSGVVRATISGPKILETRSAFNGLQKSKGDVDTDSSREMSNKTAMAPDGTAQPAVGSAAVRSREELRVVTFNILAEPFAISDHAANHMYSYCPRDYLETEYRVQLTAKELVAYDADVVCLQECDSKTFDLYLKPLFGSLGCSVHYTNKVSRSYSSPPFTTLPSSPLNLISDSLSPSASIHSPPPSRLDLL